MEMKKLLVIIMLALLIGTVMVAAIGCGDSGGGDDQKDETVVDGTVDGGEEEAEYSAVGTYESDEGKFIVLNADGTFETDDWEESTGGTYVFTQDLADYWVELTFDNGSLAVLSVIIAMDEVAAIVDDFTMVQYTKR
jgi:hypothetical protein